VDDLSLDDFGADATVDRPYCERKLIKQSPHTGKIAGFICRELRRPMTVYTSLRARSHFYREGGGYAVSDSILESLEKHHVSRILVHTGTDEESFDAYEFAIRQYTADGKDVPGHWLEDESDTQTYVPVGDALHEWPFNYDESMFKYPFRAACDRIDWRGYNSDLKDRLAARSHEA